MTQHQHPNIPNDYSDHDTSAKAERLMHEAFELAVMASEGEYRAQPVVISATTPEMFDKDRFGFLIIELVPDDYDPTIDLTVHFDQRDEDFRETRVTYEFLETPGGEVLMRLSDPIDIEAQEDALADATSIKDTDDDPEAAAMQAMLDARYKEITTMNAFEHQLNLRVASSQDIKKFEELLGVARQKVLSKN